MTYQNHDNRNEIVTANLSKFGQHELTKLALLIKAMNEQGLPYDFENSEVHPVLNTYSGYVFLTNSEYQVAMLDGEDNLRSFYSCPECGFEGFEDELEEDGGECCQEYIQEIKDAYGLSE